MCEMASPASENWYAEHLQQRASATCHSTARRKRCVLQIESLGESLMSEDETERGRAAVLLGEVSWLSFRLPSAELH